MNILFLDQSGQLGGAELSLADVAMPYRETCLVGLLADGPFRHLLEQQHIPVQVLATQPIPVRKDSHFLHSLGSFGSLVPLVARVTKIARNYDIIYANTQKALVVGAIASYLSRIPLVYHLRDILSTEHFSPTNCRLAITLANHFASLVITNSRATQAAFIKAGGCSEITEVVYNGFKPERYWTQESNINAIKQQLGLNGQFVVGHFSRLSPWKGQHILLEALAHCPHDVAAIFVGDALFGEQDYVEQLHKQVAELGLEQRVQFLGFRSDVVPLMAACDLIVHTSIAPEPFGRVIVEAMLCDRPVIATATGGVLELVEPGKTGWLVPPGNALEVANVITICRQNWESTRAIANQAQLQACERFNLATTNQQIAQLLKLYCKTD
ncbi:MAG: glycosyltransferase [Cyanobacteria bacterium CRU_2_1]|nr:glycosyltransferase [Cyanobacteria bacterium RU_5_0]NJR60484.1 glycosyltransferase [Cyanobacteria bacterium CRU_2_1]